MFCCMLGLFDAVFIPQIIFQVKAVVADQMQLYVKDIQAVSSECCICGTEPLLVAASMSCMHKPLMCKGCLSRYLDEKFQSAGLQDMKCPFSDVNGCKVCEGNLCLFSFLHVLSGHSS